MAPQDGQKLPASVPLINIEPVRPLWHNCVPSQRGDPKKPVFSI